MEEYEGWKHEDGLKGGDKVGVITRLFEDVEKRKKVLVRWFARPGAVWGPDGPDDESLGGPTLPVKFLSIHLSLSFAHSPKPYLFQSVRVVLHCRFIPLD